LEQSFSNNGKAKSASNALHILPCTIICKGGKILLCLNPKIKGLKPEIVKKKYRKTRMRLEMK